MIATKQQRRRDTKKVSASNPPTRPTTNVLSVTASGGSQVTVTFDSVVMISATTLPETWLFGTANRTITSIVSGTGTAYVFGLSGTAPATEDYNIGPNDPAARNTFGGFIAGAAGTIGV